MMKKRVSGSETRGGSVLLARIAIWATRKNDRGGSRSSSWERNGETQKLEIGAKCHLGEAQ
jgi:hypothetical protein